MDSILDIHTHGPAPRPGAVVSCSPFLLPAEGEFPGQLFSVGIHPWELPALADSELEDGLELMRGQLSRPDVAAAGECGLDLLRGGPLFRQMNWFLRQAELAGECGRPMVVHCVKAWQQVAEIRRQAGRDRPWALHGFRAKPSVAAMLAGFGFWFSFGERFNAETLGWVLSNCPDRVLAETDESRLPIQAILASMAAAAGVAASDLERMVLENTRRFLGI